MPANLTPDYKRAEERYRTAKDPGEKLEALEEMLRVVPKHKGTDGLQADLKARISKVRNQPASKVGPLRVPRRRRRPSTLRHAHGHPEALEGRPCSGRP